MREVSVDAIPLEVLFEEPQILATEEREHGRSDIVRQANYVLVRHSADHCLDAMLPRRAWFFASDEEAELTCAQLMGAFDAP